MISCWPLSKMVFSRKQPGVDGVFHRYTKASFDAENFRCDGPVVDFSIGSVGFPENVEQASGENVIAATADLLVTVWFAALLSRNRMLYEVPAVPKLTTGMLSTPPWKSLTLKSPVSVQLRAASVTKLAPPIGFSPRTSPAWTPASGCVIGA